MVKRLTVDQINTFKGGIGTPEYLSFLVERERETLLPLSNLPKESDQDVVYKTNRLGISFLALPFLTSMMAAQTEPIKVLEIGGGQGKAILKILSEIEHMPSWMAPVLFTMTSLNCLPEHEELEQKGVELSIPQMAEKLPEEWENQFDIVMSMCVLGWTEVPEAMLEIPKVVKPNGYWLGVEFLEAQPVTSPLTFSSLIPAIMHMTGMHNALTLEQVLAWANKKMIAFAYHKN